MIAPRYLLSNSNAPKKQPVTGLACQLLYLPTHPVLVHVFILHKVFRMLHLELIKATLEANNIK